MGGDTAGDRGHGGSPGVTPPPPPCVPSESGESMLQPYKFSMEEIEGLRYRCRVTGGVRQQWGALVTVGGWR